MSFQRVGVEDVNAHRRQVAFVAIFRFFVELDDALLFIHLHDAEAVRLFQRHRHDADRQVGALRQVIVDHRAVVHLVDVVSRQNEHVVGAVLANEIQILVDGVRRASVPVLAAARLVGLQQTHAAATAVEIPGFADADMIVEAVRAILRQHTDRVDAAVDAIADRKIDDAKFSGKGDGRLCPLFREDGKPRTFAAG